MDAEPSPPMPPAPFRPAGRRPPRPVKAPLTTDRILDAAFAIIAREGYDAISMRRLAQELDTGPASLYAHIESKVDLDSLIVDRVASEVVVPDPDPEHWQEQVISVMRDLRAAMGRYPGVARAVIGHIPTGFRAMQTTEGIMALMLEAGVQRQVAAWACDLLPLYVTAVAFEESVWSKSEAADGPEAEQHMIDELKLYFQALPAGTFPHLLASAVELTTGTGEERFEFGLEVLLAGIAAVSDRWPQRTA